VRQPNAATSVVCSAAKAQEGVSAAAGNAWGGGGGGWGKGSIQDEE